MWLLLALACGTPPATPGDTAPADTAPVDTAPPRTSGDECGEWISPSDGGCNDNDPWIGPYCDERCNGMDDDCDGEIDEDVSTTYYPDVDGDGFGDPAGAVHACETPAAYVVTAGDCDDLDPAVSPTAAEACNGVDDDCDGAIDEDCA